MSAILPLYWKDNKPYPKPAQEMTNPKSGRKKTHSANGNLALFPLADPKPAQEMTNPKSGRKKTHSANGQPRRHAPPSREDGKDQRKSLVLWRHPLKTLEYCGKELLFDLHTYSAKCLEYRLTLVAAALVLALLVTLFHIDGAHQAGMQLVYKKAAWYLYWVGLGVLSSVGLGTGLHTFVLYLGPHIASVALAAYECGALNFPEPPYPDQVLCPEIPDKRWPATVWNIMSKVRWESMMWGIGTALGELPPYFMARAARLSGHNPEDEDDMREFEELQRKKRRPELMTLMDRSKLFVEKLVDRVGFFGIFICASIPNPLFDLAGITCGHFLVPFWTFFGATVLGKAVVKVHLQKIFVIVASDESFVDIIISPLVHVPGFGARLQTLVKKVLASEKAKYHRKVEEEALPEAGGSIMSSLFEKFVIGMVAYFLISIINSLAQSHHKRLSKRVPSSGRKRATD
uniref:Vacuole membrane protein 1 n=1 Tax=Timema cristinae TaxID=61476 RepID=A0A7R9H1Y7_TIMCR|nr:unnamed protein product [Timema cristinae]